MCRNVQHRENYVDPPSEILEALGRSSLKECVVELTSDGGDDSVLSVQGVIRGLIRSESSVQDLIRGLQGNETIEELKVIYRVRSQSSFDDLIHVVNESTSIKRLIFEVDYSQRQSLMTDKHRNIRDSLKIEIK